MYVFLLILQLLFAQVYCGQLYNYTSGLNLPLLCPSDAFSVTQTGAFIDVPVGAVGVQIQQIVYGHRAAAPPMLTNVSVIGNGYGGEVNVPSSVKNCCTANDCDLANYALYSTGSWFETPECGQQSVCGPPVQWYSLSFENTPVGTCVGCGIMGTGNIDTTIDFQGAMVAIPDYGMGGSIYVSYYGIFPSPSPSETGSVSASISETPSPSSSASPSISASITQSTSQTASITATPTPIGCAFRNFIDNGYNYTAEQNSDYDPGQDISYQVLSGDCTTTINQCIQYCSSQSNCVGIIMDTTFVNCWTKPSLNTRTFVASRVAWHRILIPSITPSTSISPSISSSQTLSSSISSSETPSETPSPVSPTMSPSITVSSSETPSETPSPVSPSTSPSVTVSASLTKSVTPSQSPSHSPVGICNHARSMLYGTYEWVIGPTGSLYYYILHGVNVSHIYSPSYMLMGQNPSCTETATSCTCVYTQGNSAVCGFPRQSTVTYTYGTQTKTTFTLQNPACIYYFSTTLDIVSPTPSSSISPSMSPSVTPSPSPIDGIVELVADSTGDFQPVQGNNGWYYNYYNESMMINPFPDFGPNPLGVPNNWLITGSYCRINMNAIHGSSTNYCDSSAFGWCYPSLHWINTNYSYEHFIINVKASHTVYTPPGIDGVKLNISINNNQIDSYQTPFTINRNYTAVNVTDVELVLDPIHGCFSDKTDQNVKIYAYMPVVFSVTPSSSPSVSSSASASSSGSSSSSVSRSVTRSRSASKSSSATVSSSQTRTVTQTSSISVSLTTTPISFMTAWPSVSSTPTKTPTRTPAFMMTPWPSKGYTVSASETPHMYIVWYPSTSPSRLPDDIQAAILEQNKSENTAKILAGVGMGVAVLGLGAAAVQMVQGLQTANNMIPRQTQTQNDEQQRRRRRRGSDDSEEEEKKRNETEEDNVDDDGKRVNKKIHEEDEAVITRRPSLETHINEIDEGTRKKSSTSITIPSNLIQMRSDEGDEDRDMSNNTVKRSKNKGDKKEEPDYEPLISYFYYKKLQEHIQASAENNTE